MHAPVACMPRRVSDALAEPGESRARVPCVAFGPVSILAPREDPVCAHAWPMGAALLQVPPLVLDKVCVVISPLISLMEDQVAALNARRIPAAFLGTAQSSRWARLGGWVGDPWLVAEAEGRSCRAGGKTCA